MPSGTFTDFEDALRGFESGVNPETIASGYAQTFVPAAAWNAYQQSAKTPDDLRTLQYTSMNSLGFVGYQVGEALLIDLGYYTDDFYYGNGASTNTWDGTFTGKDGIHSLADLKTDLQESVMLAAFGYNLSLIDYYFTNANDGTSLAQYIGTTQHYTDANDPTKHYTADITMTGVLAAAHLRGAYGLFQLLHDGVVSADENGTSILTYMTNFGGYDSPSKAELETARTSNTTMILAEDLWHKDFNGDGKIGDQPIGGGVHNDFDGDGHMDVLFIQPGTNFNSDYLWRLSDRALVGQGGVELFDKSFSLQVVGDFDGDGKADILLQNPTTGGVWEWQMNGNLIKAQGAVDVADPTFHLLGSADFNGDGKDDLLFRNSAGSLYMWQMDGVHNTPLPVGPLDPSWHVQGAADFTGDGKADILLRKIGGATNENGAFFLWTMDGASIANQAGVERPPTAWKTLGIGDFDGDGKADFAVRNVSATGDNGAVWVYLMNGATIKSQGAAGIADAATWHVQEIGDLNADGKDDILFRNDAGYFYSWDMNGTHIASEGLLQGAAQWADPHLTVVTQHWDLV